MDPEYPTSKSAAAAFLSRAQFHTANTTSIIKRDYNDQKASQLLGALSDLVFAEAQIEAWSADLGSTGCQA